MKYSPNLFLVQPRWTRVLLGCSFSGMLVGACSVGRRSISRPELVSLVVRKDCARAGLQRSKLLVAWFDGADTAFVRYPDDASNPLEPDSPVQIGSATTAFYVPKFLAALADAGLTPGATAFRCGAGAEVSYRQLLLHHAGLPVSSPRLDTADVSDLEAARQLFCGSMELADTSTYRFSHWNYALARFALGRGPYAAFEQELRSLPVSYALPDSVRAKLPPSQSQGASPGGGAVGVFGPSTAGLASARTLLNLLNPETAEALSNYPTAATLPGQPGVRVTYGWHVLEKPGNLRVYLATGTTRYYSATLAYLPQTRTGVVAVSTSGASVDCVALDVLRNLNQNWRRNP